MGQKIVAKTLDECLRIAANKLSKPQSNIKYTIISQKKGLFHKECIIDVEDEQEVEREDKKSDIEEEVMNTKPVEIIQPERVKVEDGKITLLTNENEYFNLKVDSSVTLTIDGMPFLEDQKVNSNSVIKYSCQGVKGSRNMKLTTNDLEARISIDYDLPLIGSVKCNIRGTTLFVNLDLQKADDMPHYTVDEIRKVLSDKNIVYGIDEEAIKKASTDSKVDNLLIAKGVKAIDDEDDEIKINDIEERKADNDHENKKIDYRAARTIKSVDVGDLIAELIIGREGKDGINIYGNPIKRKLKKSLQLKAGEGCKIEGNQVIAIREGQLSIKGNTFIVHQVLEVDNDVDIKSGSIKFVGDVKINRNVSEGMTVEVGNNLEIEGNVEQATIMARGNCILRGSVINSRVYVGVEGEDEHDKLTKLNKLLNDVNIIIACLKELEEKGVLDGKNVGQVARLIIDSKCRSTNSDGNEVLKLQIEGDNFIRLKQVIKSKIVGLGPASIKYSQELNEVKERLETEIEPIQARLNESSNIYLNYIQDSNITTTGNAYIEGKGQYTSKINSMGDITFTRDNAVCRGGELIAGGNISAKTIGSTGGVSTILRVPKDGVITAEVAYNNTIFFFGERKYTLEIPSKKLKAYMENGEINVDKLIL